MSLDRKHPSRRDGSIVKMKKFRRGLTHTEKPSRPGKAVNVRASLKRERTSTAPAPIAAGAEAGRLTTSLEDNGVRPISGVSLTIEGGGEVKIEEEIEPEVEASKSIAPLRYRYWGRHFREPAAAGRKLDFKSPSCSARIEAQMRKSGQNGVENTGENA